MAVQSVSRRAAVSLSWVGQYSDILLAGVVVLIIGLMIVPVPAMLLDLLLAVQIGSALTVLVLAMYIQRPLQFAVFPSVLLFITLFRLGLNISATRLVLLEGSAGSIIAAFGQFVVGGNYIVGAVIFAIIMVIQFVVITNGAGRIAEVAARFTLDAMPGKQMAIDADLSAGMITEPEARQRRRDVQREADFYGAMDGASKFVRGDAIAALIIVVVNILGGFAIGVIQLGIPLVQALQRYTLLTIGEGLVSQIPALLVSTAAGIMVTRAAAEADLGRDFARTITSNPRVLMVVGGLLLIIGAVPGLPKLPFLLVAASAGAIGYILSQAAGEPAGALEPAEAPKAPVGPLESVIDLLQVDPMELEIGYGLIPLVDAAQGGTLLSRITMIRRQIALDLGVILPTIRVRDNLQLRPNSYVVKLRGVEIASGEVMSNLYLAMNPGLAEEAIDGIPTTEPAFGLPALWITASQKERAESLGYTVVDPASVLTTHLTEVIKQHAPEILSRQDVQTLLDNLKKDHPAVVEELVPNLLTIGEIQRVLQNLLAERVSTRDLVTVLEALATNARLTRDPELLTEFVRRALARSIASQLRGPDNVLNVIMLSPEVEHLLASALQQTEHGTLIALDPNLAARMMTRLAREMERLAAVGQQPVVLCSSKIRLPLRKLTERSLPNLVVLSFSEIPSGIDAKSSGVVDLEP